MARILIADDHPFFRLGVEAVLKVAGHEVVGMTGDGESTLEAVTDVDPDILLLDVRLPNRNGIATLQELRRRGDNRSVIILTVEMSDDQLLAAIRARANGIVFKHYGEGALLDAIKAVSSGLQYLEADLFEKALSHANSNNSRSQIEHLTQKEREVARHVAHGLRNREIAEKLDTTEGTVKVYLHNIYTKLGISNRTELATIVLNELQA